MAKGKDSSILCFITVIMHFLEKNCIRYFWKNKAFYKNEKRKK